MKNLLAIFLFFLLIASISGCQKEYTIDLQNNNNNPIINNNTKTSYLPLTAGSWRKYRDTATDVITTETVLTLKKSINNIPYTAILTENTAQKDTFWASSTPPLYDYYIKGLNPISGQPYEVHFNFLNDTASTSFNRNYQAGQGNGFISYMNAKIIERNITMMVAGKEYTNVIHSQLILSYNLLGTTEEFMAYDFYTAKGIGIIKLRTEGLYPLIAGSKTCSDIIYYNIK